jgi:hypothetical protein
MIRVGSSWGAKGGALRTTLSGAATVADVRAWEEGLRREPGALPPGTRFRLLYDLDGFAPTDMEVHEAMRAVVPGVPAAHGMRPAVLDLFDPPPEVPVTAANGADRPARPAVLHGRRGRRAVARGTAVGAGGLGMTARRDDTTGGPRPDGG